MGRRGAEQPRGGEEFSYGCVGVNAEQVGIPQHVDHHMKERTICYGLGCGPLPQNSYAEVLITQYLIMGLYLEKRPLRN